MFRVFCSCSYLFTFLLSSRFYWHILLNQQLTFSTHPVLSRRRERQLCVGRKPCGLRDGSELTICHCQSTNSNNYSADSRKARRRTNSNGDDICFCVVIRRLGWRRGTARHSTSVESFSYIHTYIHTYILKCLSCPAYAAQTCSWVQFTKPNPTHDFTDPTHHLTNQSQPNPSS